MYGAMQMKLYAFVTCARQAMQLCAPVTLSAHNPVHFNRPFWRTNNKYETYVAATWY